MLTKDEGSSNNIILPDCDEDVDDMKNGLNAERKAYCSTSESLERFRAAEMEQLSEQLARLPTGDVRAYLEGVRTIADDLKAKSDGYRERICCIQENLPEKLSELRTMREHLISLKVEIVTLLKEFVTERDSMLDFLNQNAPDLLEQMKSASSLQSKLERFRFAKSWISAKQKTKKALADSDFLALYDSLLQINCDPEFNLSNEEEMALKQGRKKLNHNVSESLLQTVRGIFKEIGFPFEDSVDHRSYERHIERLTAILKCMNYIAFRSEDSQTFRNRTVDILFEPFEVRFRYHFYSDRKTNMDSKPEWFFTQIFDWLSSNCEFIEVVLHSDSFDEKECEALLYSFNCKLIDLAVEKTKEVLRRVADDSVLFSHLIDETSAFEGELRDSMLLVPVGRVIAVFCEDPYLKRWIELERDSCTCGVENLLNSESRWKNRYREVADLDAHRVPECTDQFILMLESITKRYRWITDVEIQATFLNLQILLLDDYRLRTVQISQQLASPWEEPFIQLLNSFWYIRCVLDEWTDADMFLRVQVCCKGPKLRGKFEEIADMYRHVWRQRASDLARAFGQYTRSQLSAYRNLHWYAMDSKGSQELTPSFCPFLLEVRSLLSRIVSSISPDSAVTLYKMLNIQIVEALLELIGSTSFNCNGASQMLYDITSSLIPVLNSFYSRSAVSTFEALDEPKFEEVLASLRILSMPVATATLLRSELKKCPEEMAPSLLAPHDASCIEYSRALDLFEQRCDILRDSDAVVRF